MKTHFSKRVLSLLLSAILIATMLPSFVITANADESDYFLMTYFTGNLQTEQQIRFAVSTDGANFKPLYGGNAVLQEKSTDTHSYDGYTNTDGVRDPYIFKSPADNYYYCIATDLEATAYGFWGNQSQMVIWRSADLINWSDAYYINVAQICNNKRGTSFTNSDFQRTWAPEIYYENGQYMVYFALAGGDYQATRMHYMLTDNLMDWTHYSAPQVLYDPGYDDIDADIVKEGSTYYMFYKDETPGRSTVCLATATNMTGPYSYVAQFDTTSATGGIEGCEVYTVGSNYYLVADRFGAAGNFAIYNMGSSLSAVAAAADAGHISVSSSPVSTVEELYGFTNLTPRHGSIVHITQSEYNALVAASGGVTDSDIMYNFTTFYNQTKTGWAYDTYHDSSLHDIDIMFKENDSSAKIAHDSGYATLKNTTFFVNDATVRGMLPDDVYTVSFDYSLESTTNLSAPIFALGTGAGAPSEYTDYVMVFGNGDMWVRKSGESSDTKVGSAPLSLGVTYHYDIVSDGTNITFYRDGGVVGKIAATVDFPSSGTRYAAFGYTDGHSTNGYGYGSYSHIRFRDSAVSADTLKAELNRNLIYHKDTGSDSYGGRGSVINVSHSGDHNIVEPVISHNSSSYTLAGWVNPGTSVDYNTVIMGLGNRKSTPSPKGRYFAVREDGTICFNYCSGSNSGGNWSEHFIDVTSAFTLTADEWCYLQINIVPISDNQVKLTVWKNGVQTKSQDITLTTKVDNNDTTGNDYSYGMLGFMQLPTNYMFLGRMDVPDWWQNASGTTYVQDVRFYSQAMDPANLYAAEVAEQEIVSDYSKLNTIPTFTANAYHQAQIATGGFSNNVYSSGASTSEWGTVSYTSTSASANYGNNNGNHYGNLKNLNFALPMPSRTVLVYDGVNDASLPIEMELWHSSGGKGKIEYIAYHGTDTNGTQGSQFVLNDYWYGFDEENRSGGPSDPWNVWQGTKYNESNYTSPGKDWQGKFGGKTDKTDFDTIHDGGNKMYWWNSVHYNGSGDTVDYYEHFSTLTFNLYGCTSNGWNDWSNQYLQNENAQVYVLNYKPVRDILSGTTKVNIGGNNYTAAQLYSYFIANIESNKWQYTEESIDQYYKAMYYLMHSNPNDFTYSSDIAGNVQKCAYNIKMAAEEFPQIKFVKKTFDINYNRASGFSSETVTAGNNLAHAPSQSATVYNNDLTHTVYNWESSNAPSNSHMPTSDEIYTEESTTSACNHTGSNHVNAVGDTNGYTEHPCSVCNHNDSANNVWDDRSTDWTEYKTAAATVATNYADTQYTTSSREAYKTAADTVTGSVTTVDDASKSESYIDGKTADLATAARKLNHVADFSSLDSTVSDKASTKATNNSNGTTNVYTYDSWVAFAEAYTNGQTYTSKNAAQRADTPMYATDGSGYVSSDLSTDQTNINTYNTAIGTNYTALVTVDDNDKYQSYESAKALVNGSLDSRKYTTAGLNYINGEISTADGNVYKTLTSAEATRYNACTGTSLSAGAVLRNATGGATDTNTASVLSASTTLNSAENKDDYIKKYTVTFTIQDDKDTPTTLSGGTINGSAATSASISYGDDALLAVPDSLLSSYSITNWGTENRNDANSATESSQKVSGNIGSSYKKVVSGNIDVVAELSSTATVASGYRYNICDAYGRVDDVQYGSNALSTGTGIASVTINSKALTAKSIPFYEFQSWTVTYKEATKTYTIKPVYSVETYYNFTVTGGTISHSRQKYDTRVTLSCDNEDFWAWAVKTSGGKYQIASYNANYFFFACANEDYVAIIKDGTTFKTTETTPVTLSSSNIDGVIAESNELDTAARDAIVADKLTNKKPFISIQNKTMTTNQARVYARVTKGATGTSSYGLLIRKGSYPSASDVTPASADLNRNITTIIEETGQFTYTLNSKNGFNNPVTFRAYIDYDASYEVGVNSYTINARDYSAVAVASRA